MVRWRKKLSQVILIGIVVKEAFNFFPGAGRIFLQCEGSEIFFRRLERRRLKKHSAEPTGGASRV